MKVLVVGFCKTGTKSVDRALEVLGYKASDSVRNVYELSDNWKQFLVGKGKSEDLKKMFQGYDSASDLPAFIYWRDFLKAFPDIKLIYMTRDEDGWLKSWKKQIHEENNTFTCFERLFSRNVRQWFHFGHSCYQVMFEAPPSRFLLRNAEIDDESLRRGFRNHNKDILENAPRDRLLCFNLNEGWDPLCKFLGLEVPSVPFPHRNKNGGIMKERIENEPYFMHVRNQAYRNFSLLTSLVAVALTATYVYLL